MMFRKLTRLLAAAFALSGASAHSEQLTIDGVYAARTDGARGVHEITLDPISGREGLALERALADQLGSAQVDGEPLFRLVQPAPGRELYDHGGATLRGFVRSDAFDLSDGVIEQTTCLRKVAVDEKRQKQCVESLTETFECRRLHVTFKPEVALIVEEGTLYRREDSFVDSERYCADSSYVPSATAMLDAMVSRFARLVRLDLAPVRRLNRFHILESRKGLKGPDREEFKQAIRLTKSDPIGACMAFEDILSRNPFQRSTLYNAALCREADGQLDLAAEAYDQLVLASDSSRFSSGRARVESRFRAQEQLAMLDRNVASLATADNRRRQGN